MRRKLVGAIAVGSLIGVPTVIAAAPAYSVETITCITNGTASPISLEGSGTSFTFDNEAFSCNRVTVSATEDVNVGDITVVQSTVYPLDFRTTGESPPGVNISEEARQGMTQTNFGTLITYTGSAASGTIIVDFDRQGTGRTARYEISFTQGGGDDPSPIASVADVGPGTHIQQFPLPETATCNEGQPEGLDWGGVASGGWSVSWAQWVNDGEGGEVCTRTLVYNASAAAWQVD